MKKLFVILVTIAAFGLTSCVDDNMAEIEQNVPEFKAPNNGGGPGHKPPRP